MKRWICLLLAALLLLTPAMALEQPTDEELKISAPSAILMERSTGTVLYEKNADEHLSPASVTKIMTLLLIMEQGKGTRYEHLRPTMVALIAEQIEPLLADEENALLLTSRERSVAFFCKMRYLRALHGGEGYALFLT